MERMKRRFSTYEIINRLNRIEDDPDARLEAADLLEFLLSRFESHSLHMDGNHAWRFSTGWPWKYATGPTIETALKAALVEYERGMAEMVARKKRHSDEKLDRVVQLVKDGQ